MRSLVTFIAKEFNSTETKDHFINPDCYGDDVCQWLIAELRTAGVDVDEEPQQEDFGWYFRFRLPVGKFCFVVSCRTSGEEALWIGWVERQCGLIGSMLGQRLKNVSPHAIETIHRVLSRSPKITGVLWHNHEKFQNGYERSGAESPND